MPALKDQKHEKFSQKVAKGESDVGAYKASFKCSLACAEKNAWRLRDYEGVKKRINELMEKTAAETVMTVRERREIATQIARNKFNEPAIRLNATVIEAKHAMEFRERQDITTDGAPLPSVAPQIIIQTGPHWSKPRTG